MMRKILIVDDNEMNRRILKKMLGEEYDVIEAENGKEALEILRRKYKMISAVLLDIIMPVMDGYGVLKQMHANPMLSLIPVIVMTQSNDVGAEIKALTFGANDFIAKPYSAEIIRFRLRNTIRLRESSATINTLQHDKLTGLYTREAFLDKADTLIESNEAGYYVLSCMDIDNFKVVNDLYGSDKGDEVLKYVAETLKSGIEDIGGIVCRIAADTFAAVYPRRFIESGEIDSLREEVCRLDGTVPPITISTGRYSIENAKISVSAMYDRAAIAMSRVKGRYDCHIADYDESMREELLREQELVTEVTPALKNRNFEVWFQPQINHATGETVGAEALVRWHHPIKGLIPPNDFIPVFERNGFIYELDKYVWEQTCVLLRKWLDEGRNVLPVSVNISRYDVLRDDIIAVIVGLTQKYDIPTDLLRFEITETAFVKSRERVIDFVTDLVGRGFIVEIDDFGSGYSSLNTLKDVPAQVVKLDMRFLETDGPTDRGASILESVVRMAKWLGMSVIAEGVEKKEQADYLKSIGCSLIQGYYYAMPMPVEVYEMKTERFTGGRVPEIMPKKDDIGGSLFGTDGGNTNLFDSYIGCACVFEYSADKIELLRVSDKYTELIGSVGMTVDDALALDWKKYLDAESLKEVDAAIKKSVETRSEVICQYIFVNLPGCSERVYMRSTMKVVAVTDDRSLVYCVNENITEQRQAEQNERRLTERLQVVMDNAASGITAVTFDGKNVKFLLANNRFYEMLGYTREQYLNEVSDIFSIIHPDDLQLLLDTAERVGRTGESAVIEYRARRRDNREIWIKHVISTTRFDEVDEIVQLSVFTDITERKNTETKIKENDEKLRFLNETAGLLLEHAESEYGLENVLKKIAGFFGGDRAFIYEYRYDENICAKTYEYNADREKDFGEKFSAFPLDSAVCWIKLFEKSRFISINDCTNLGEGRETEEEVYRALDVHSVFAVSLSANGKILGTMGVFNPSQRTDDRETLSTLSEYSSAILLRRDMNRRIEKDRKTIANMMNDTPGGFVQFSVTEDGGLAPTYINEPFCRLVGFSKELLMYDDGTDATSMAHPDDLETVKTAIKEILADGGTHSLKCRIKCGSGDFIPLSVFGRVSENENGETVINAYFADMTEQERKDYSIRETTPFILSAIMSSSADLSFAKDKDFNYICCSPAFVKFAGQTDESDIIGKNDYDFFDKKTADGFRKDDMRLFEDGISLVNYVEQIPSDDDKQHYSNTSKYILRDSLGKIIGLYGVGRDITEERTAFERLKLLTDSIPGGIAAYLITPDSIRLVYFNDGYCGIFGFTREEYANESGNMVMSLIFEEDIPLLMSQIDEMRRGCDRVMNCTYRVHCRGGLGYKWINQRGSIAERRGDTILINAVLYDMTEAKLAEESYRIHEEEMMLAMSQLGKMICEYDSASHTLTMPEAYAERYNAAAVLGGIPESAEDRGIVITEDFAAFTALYDAIGRGDKKGSAEYRNRWADGTVHWEHAVFSAVFDTEGRPVKAIIAVEDTTQQHLAYEIEQNRPSAAEENLIGRALFNLTTNETLEYFKKDGVLMPVEEQPETFGGGRKIADMIIDGDERRRYLELHNVENLLERFENGETEHTIEYRRQLLNGEIYWVKNTLRLMRKPCENDVLLFEYCYNINDEKTTELMFTSFVNDTYDYVIQVNLNTHRFSMFLNPKVNSGIIPELGDDIDTAAGEFAMRYVHPDDREMTVNNMLAKGIANNLTERERFQFTCREVNHDGDVLYKKITEYYLDRERGIAVVTREDITQLMRDEAKKSAVLSTALEAANQASRAKTQFLSRMSHELRTPMNAIIGLSALSASDVNNPEIMSDNIAKISMSARYLLSLINDILEMSRIESGRMTLNEAPFDFEQFISEINSIIHAQTSQKGIDYDAVADSCMESSYVGDAIKLQEVLVNVLGNAVKFTPSGGKITFSMEQVRCDDKHAVLRFSISDTGVGIDSEFIPHMFEPFSQEAANQTTSTSGTGLGLAITKNLVEMMNGSIDVQSIRKVGTVFTIEVRLGIAEKAGQVPDIASEIETDKLNVLIADDDASVCRSAEGIFRNMGIKAEWVDSGIKAVERAETVHRENSDFTTFLIDWQMPDADGIETAARLRRFIPRDAAVVIMTAYDWREIEEHAMEIGVDTFVEKPLFRSSIERLLKKLYAEKKPAVKETKPEAADFAGRCFLLAEDNALNVEIAKRLLEKCGAKVVVANNGLEAMEIFTTAADNTFDAILMDIRMPVMDGLTAAKNIRSLRKEGSKTIPIIAMTANAFNEDVEMSMNSGMNAHLAKPIDPELLFSTLKRMIGSAESAKS